MKENVNYIEISEMKIFVFFFVVYGLFLSLIWKVKKRFSRANALLKVEKIDNKLWWCCISRKILIKD